MQHVYHWKHGWIPLDHIAALSKAKGSHKAAAKMLRDVADNHHVLTRDQHAQALRGLSSIESPADRAAALKSALARADAAGHGDVAPVSLRRSAGTRERLRGDLKTAQTAQQARAEEQGKGYKSETAAFYGSSKHATAAHSETKLTQSHADREATARAAADREEARAYAERKKAGHIADDLERLDGVHAPDAHAATQAALEARTLASVRAKGMKPADVDATLQAAMRLPESPQQQALVSALATHLTELKAKADAHPVKAAADVNAAAGARHDAHKATAEADVKRTNIAAALQNGADSVPMAALDDLAGSDHPSAAKAQAELEKRATARIATAGNVTPALLEQAKTLPDTPANRALVKAIKAKLAAPKPATGPSAFAQKTAEIEAQTAAYKARLKARA